MKEKGEKDAKKTFVYKRRGGIDPEVRSQILFEICRRINEKRFQELMTDFIFNEENHCNGQDESPCRRKKRQSNG